MALASGGREHFGWGVDRHITADLYDAINQNTRASGNWNGRPPKLPPWPRPNPAQKTPEQKKPTSVADLYKRFTASKG